MRHLATAGAILLALALPAATPAAAAHRHQAASGHAAVVGLVAAAARRHGVPVMLELAIVDVESGFNPRARNGSSTGLGQIKPGTARDAGCRGSLRDAVANADCSARILAVLLRDAGGDWRRAAAHYNQGRYARESAGAGYARLVLARVRRPA